MTAFINGEITSSFQLCSVYLNEHPTYRGDPAVPSCVRLPHLFLTLALTPSTPQPDQRSVLFDRYDVATGYPGREAYLHPTKHQDRRAAPNPPQACRSLGAHRCACSSLPRHRSHTHPIYLPAAHFDPDRFLDERLGQYLTPNPLIFMPFNVGPRICPGRQVRLSSRLHAYRRLTRSSSRTRSPHSCSPVYYRTFQHSNSLSTHRARSVLARCGLTHILLSSSRCVGC